MAQKTISTKLAISGEAEYRSKMQGVNSELKTLGSNLKLVESDFRGNANGIEALSAKGNALKESFAAQQNAVKTLEDALKNAEKAMGAYSAKNEELKGRIDANKIALSSMDSSTQAAGEEWAKYASKAENAQKKLDLLKKSSGDTSEEQEKLKAQISAAEQAMKELEDSTNGAARTAGEMTLENQKLNKELAENESCISATQKGIDIWQQKLNEAKVKLNELDGEIQTNNQHLIEAKTSADGTAESIDEFGNRTDQSKSSVEKLNEVLVSAGLIAALKKVADAFISCAEASIDFESAMAGVAKTTDLTDTELADMANSLQDMSTKIPVAATELASIAESAGQLGIAKENIVDFTSTIADLTTATNMTSEQAATTLARFANITGMAQTDFDRLGSSIVSLGNNFATTESEIADMALRLAGAGAQIKLSEGDILGIATALSSLGIESQAGGSAFSRVMTQIQVAVETGSNKLNDFASIANMSAEDFARAFKEDAASAITEFIIELGNAEEKGTSVTLMLEELGIKELRMADALKRSANASELFADALEVGNNAWTENTALVKEAETRYATTESKLGMLSNAAENLQATFGDGLTPAIRNLADAGTGGLNFLSDFIGDNEILVPILTGAATAVGALAVGVAGYTLVTQAAEIAQDAFNTSLLTSPLGWAALAIGAVVTGFVAISSAVENANADVKEMTVSARALEGAFEDSQASYEQTETSILGAVAAAEPYISHLEEIQTESIAAGQATDEYNLCIDKLRALLPDINIAVDKETGLLIENAAAIREAADEWKNFAIEQALATKYEEQMAAWGAAALELAENEVKLISLTTEYNNSIEERRSLLKEYEENIQEQKRITDDSTLSFDAQTKSLGELSTREAEINDLLRELTDEITENEKAQKPFNEAIENGKEEMAGFEEEINLASEGAKNYSDAQRDATDSTGEFVDKAAEQEKALQDLADSWGVSVEDIQKYMDENSASMEDWEAEQIKVVQEVADEWGIVPESIQEALSNTRMTLDEFEEAMQAYQDAVLEKVDGVVNGFQKIPMEFEMSAQEMLSNLIANKETYAEWEETMAEITRKLGSTAAEEFGKLGPAATGAMQEILATPDLLEGYREAFGVKIDETTGEVIEKWNDPEFIGAPNAALSEAASKARDNSDIVEAIGGLGQDSLDKFKETVNADEYDTATSEAIDGATDAVETKSPETIEAVQDAADEITKISKQGGVGAVKEFTSEFNKITSKTKTILSQLKETLNGEMSTLPDSMYTVGVNMVDGMISGLNSRSSSLYSTVRNIVNSAVASANSAAEINSPSRKTMQTGIWMGEGLILGAESKRDEFKRTLQGIVDDALALDISAAQANVPVMDTVMPSLSDYYASVNPVAANAGVEVIVQIDEFNNYDTDNDIKDITQKVSTQLGREARRLNMWKG